MMVVIPGRCHSRSLSFPVVVILGRRLVGSHGVERLTGWNAHGSGCLDRGVVPPGRTTPRGRVGGRGQHRLWDVVTPRRIPWCGVVWSGLVGSGIVGSSGWEGGVVPVAVVGDGGG